MTWVGSWQCCWGEDSGVLVYADVSTGHITGDLNTTNYYFTACSLSSLWWVNLEPQEFANTCHITPLCKIPKPTTTYLNCILYTILMYQQHILSLHPVCLHHTTVAVCCVLSQLHHHYMLYWISMFPWASFCIMATACIKTQWIFLKMQHNFSDIRHNSLFAIPSPVLYTWPS